MVADSRVRDQRNAAPSVDIASLDLKSLQNKVTKASSASGKKSTRNFPSDENGAHRK